MKVYFMGCQVPVAPVWQRPERQRRSGARLVEQFGNYNPDTTIFNHDIRANAKGYEYCCYMFLRHQSKSGRR